MRYPPHPAHITPHEARSELHVEVELQAIVIDIGLTRRVCHVHIPLVEEISCVQNPIFARRIGGSKDPALGVRDSIGEIRVNQGKTTP